MAKKQAPAEGTDKPATTPEAPAAEKAKPAPEAKKPKEAKAKPDAAGDSTTPTVQEAIGAALEVAQTTISDVIKRLTDKRNPSFSGKLDDPPTPELDLDEEDDDPAPPPIEPAKPLARRVAARPGESREVSLAHAPPGAATLQGRGGGARQQDGAHGLGAAGPWCHLSGA